MPLCCRVTLSVSPTTRIPRLQSAQDLICVHTSVFECKVSSFLSLYSNSSITDQQHSTAVNNQLPATFNTNNEYLSWSLPSPAMVTCHEGYGHLPPPMYTPSPLKVSHLDRLLCVISWETSVYVQAAGTNTQSSQLHRTTSVP